MSQRAHGHDGDCQKSNNQFEVHNAPSFAGFKAYQMRALQKGLLRESNAYRVQSGNEATLSAVAAKNILLWCARPAGPRRRLLGDDGLTCGVAAKQISASPCDGYNLRGYVARQVSAPVDKTEGHE